MSDGPGDDLPTAVLGARFSEAVRWASMLHADQCRKGTRIAYASHLLGVASLVLEDGGTEEDAIAAVLHDAVEDRGVAEAEIRARFGEHVARVVVACSDGVDGPRDSTDWKLRKEGYLHHLEHDDLPDGTLRVAAADKLHNARSILTDLRVHGARTLSRFNAPGNEQAWYYTELLRVLELRHPDSVVTSELGRVVSELVTELERSSSTPT
ncbi:MAG: HD domain-containing protein [Acidimicrobiia bacterium]|nr:HD domain-containing protein [Acidimicrobiia bacterium]